MKIALLSEKYTPDIGGLAISSERLAQLLASAGYKVRVFAPNLSLPPSEQRPLPSNGVSVTRFGAHTRVDETQVDWFELIVEEHKREPFDLLHAYFLTQAGFIGTYAGKYLNVPSVVSIRGNDIERAAFDPSRFSHVMYALQNASAVTTNATELAKKAKAFVDREIHLIPNGVDTEHFKPKEKIARLIQTLRLIPPEPNGHTPYLGQQHVSRFQQRIIGFVGELREKKGLKTLLSAYAQANKAQPAALLVVGTIRQGADREFFEEFLASNSNLQITITGQISPGDLPAYYALMDVFVHPSLRDGMPNALLEAMACGKAVVATPVGGVSEVIQDRVDGAIVPVNDADALSGAILELLENDPLRRSLGESARRKIIANYTLERELTGNLEVYRRLGLNP
ncbi:MAG: glycosyltransferase family 4 protein [Anaerolineae bacterium]|nr:glycosyltransferase family 4 protein [Anaerolineae bacterium]